MKFIINNPDLLKISDTELTEVLNNVFVEGGYTDSNLAESIFNPKSIRERGILIGARDNKTSELAGMIILVPFTSSSCKMATDNEAEIHLLCVKPIFRKHGLGRLLVEACLSEAVRHDFKKIILWTQVSMTNAQALYESVGFIKKDQMTVNNIDFLVYEKVMCVQ